MKKVVSLVLILCLAISLCVPAMAADGYTDVPEKHWAFKQVNYLTGQQVITGYGNGEFRPDVKVNRAEYITMMVKLFGLKTTAAIDFTNVPEWAKESVQKAKAQGFLLNYAKDTDFGEKVTREEAVALLMRYLNLAAPSSSTTYITDLTSVSSEYRDYVVSAVANGIIRGYEDSSFRPKNILTRAEALTMLYQAAGQLYSYVCSYANYAPSVNATINGSIALEGRAINGRLIVAEDVPYAMLSNCRVSGPVSARGSNLILENTDLDTLDVIGNGEVLLKKGTDISTLNIYGAAKITIEEGCSVKNLYVQKSGANAEIKGKGTVGKIWVYADGVVTSMLPAEYFVDKGIIATLAGLPFAAGSGKTSMTGVASAYVSGGNAYPYKDFNYTADKNLIVIDVVPQVDGYIYVAAWDRSLDALSAEEIIASSYNYKSVKAGEDVRFTLKTEKEYSEYNVGLVVTSSVNKETIVFKPLYNSESITYIKKAMSMDAPSNVVLDVPSWTATETYGSIYIEFNQYMYYDDPYTKTSFGLEFLSKEDLAKLFSVERVVKTTKPEWGYYGPAVTEKCDFTISCAVAYDLKTGPYHVICITPSEGMAKGVTFNFYFSKNITNYNNVAPASNSGNVVAK